MALHKFIRLLLAVLLVVATFAACANTAGQQGDTDTPTDSVNELPDTPVRVGTEGVSSPYFEKTFTMEGAIAESDLVVDLTITGWLGEYTHVLKTFFEAKINSTLVGDKFYTITLLQDGNSEWTFIDYPLFQKGDRLLVFLKKAVDIPEYENPYWIVGSYTSLMDIQEHDGTTYVMDRFGLLTEDIVNVEQVKAVDASTSRLLQSQIEAHDPILARNESIHKNILTYDNLIEEIADIIDGGSK